MHISCCMTSFIQGRSSLPRRHRPLQSSPAGSEAQHSQQVRASPCSDTGFTTSSGSSIPGTVTHPGRRHLLLTLSTLPFLQQAAEPVGVRAATRPAAGDWSSPGLATPDDDYAPRFFKLADGVKIQELVAGTGPAAQPGDYVTLNYVLRRPNGYFIYATVEGVSFQPRDVPVGPVTYKLGDQTVITGLQEVLQGMQAGGKRRALIPPEVGYVDQSLEPQPPTFATKRQLTNHSSEPLLFEIQVLRVRPSPASASASLN